MTRLPSRLLSALQWAILAPVIVVLFLALAMIALIDWPFEWAIGRLDAVGAR